MRSTVGAAYKLNDEWTALGKNLWIGIGWNVFGFADKDLNAQHYTNAGVYLRLRWKFDEALLRRATE